MKIWEPRHKHGVTAGEERRGSEQLTLEAEKMRKARWEKDQTRTVINRPNLEE